jgi:HisJ family histidinol phosphate phosphatase
MQLDFDHHIHTVYSQHAHEEMVVARILPAAVAAGLKRIVVLEHIPTIGAPGLTLSGWREGRNHRESLDRIAAELREVEGRYPSLQVLRGAEVDGDPLRLDGSLMLEDLSGLDVVLGATHVFPGATGFWYEKCQLAPEKARELANTWREWLLKLLRGGRWDVLAHPGDLVAVARLLPPYDRPETQEFFAPVLRTMREQHVAFELNELLGSKLPPSYREAYPALVRAAREAGLEFSVSSDAHQPDRIGHFVWVRELIEECGVTEKEFWVPKGSRK